MSTYFELKKDYEKLLRANERLVEQQVYDKQERCRMEKLILQQDRTIEEYQKHYSKYTHFYADFEAMRSRLANFLRHVE